MEILFKIGDRVRFLGIKSSDGKSIENDTTNKHRGLITKVTGVIRGGSYPYQIIVGNDTLDLRANELERVDLVIDDNDNII